MCLAEALLRIPDSATRDALIRDKIGGGDWRSHLGHSPSLFVNAATWGLVVTGKLTATSSEAGPVGGADAPDRARRRAGDPQGRRPRHADDGRAVRHRPDHRRGAGEQPPHGGQGLPLFLRHAGRGRDHGRRRRRATTATTSRRDPRHRQGRRRARHLRRPRHLDQALGPAPALFARAAGPRDGRTAAARAGAGRARQRYDIGLNIDAEEADRLELSLDLLEALCFEPELAGWNGIGFVVQAYSKRAPFVLDYIIDLARRSGHRLMVRLVKGAYWDSEIKRAQVDGLEGFPVFTRKVHTDVSYLACARKLLAAPDAVFPQFATHNAQTLATIYAMAGGDFQRRPVRVPVPARHGRAAVRRGGRHGEARPALPHLRAGRHARDAAGLPGAPPAGERRQLLLRQPHRRRTRSRSRS